MSCTRITGVANGRFPSLVHAMYGDDTKKLGRDEPRECKTAKNAFHFTAPVGSIRMELTRSP